MNSLRNDAGLYERLCKGILIVLICIPLGITVVRYAAWKMAVYLFFWILCPGLFVNRYLWKQDHKNIVMSVFSAFFMGMALVIAEWFVLYVVGFRQLIIYINPCLSIAFFAQYFVERKRGSVPGRRYSIDLSFLVLLCVAVYLCAYHLNFTMPRAIDIRSADCTWQIGNINQLASDFPLRDIRVAGVKTRYHFFATLFLAIAKYIFGGDGWIYFAQYQIWFLPFAIAASLWLLYNRVTENKIFVTVMSVATMAGFMLNNSYGKWHYHLFSNVNSSGLGITCLLLLFLNLKKTEFIFFEKGRQKKERLLWAAQQLVFLFLLTGIKGPFALLYVLSVCVWSVIQCLKGKIQGGGLLCFAMGNALIFALMFRFLFVSGTEGFFLAGNGDSILLSVLNGKEVADLFQRSGVQGIAGRALFLLPSLAATFTFLTPFGLLAIYDLIRYFLGKNNVRDDLVFASIFAGGGLCAFYLFHASDNSQVYFLFAAIPFVGYLCFDQVFTLMKKDAWKNVFCMVVLIFTMLENEMTQTITAFPGRLVNFLTVSYSEADPQRALAFEAYDFLREHTDKNALIATNYQGGGTYHGISTFGERRCYLEGYDYSISNFGFAEKETRLREMRELFGAEWSIEDRLGFCQAFEIDYLVVYKDIGDAAVEPLKAADVFTLAYENERMAVFAAER